MTLIACEGAPARSKPWRNATPSNPEPSADVAERLLSENRERHDRLARDSLRVAVAALPSLELGGGDIGLLRGAVFETLTSRIAKVELAATGIGITIELRADIKTHAGRVLSASDVRTSIAIARRASGGFASDLRDISAIEVVSPTRLRIRLRRANGFVVRVLSEIPIAGSRGRDGTGPLRIVEVGSSAVILEPFADYDGGGVRSPVELIAVADPASALARVQVGELDIALDRRAAGTLELGVASRRLEPARFRYLAFGGKRSLFDDPEVRRAASLMLDRLAIASDGHRGRAVARQLPLWPGGPVSAPASPVRRADRAAASELLDRAGWAQVSDGTRERDKQKLIALAITGNASDPTVSLAFDQLRSGGFVLDVRELKPAALEKALRDGEFDVAVLEWNGYSDWDLSPLLESRGASNRSRIASSVLDDALASLRAAPSAQGREEGAARLAVAIDEVVPIATLVQPLELVFFGDRVRGIEDLVGRLDLSQLSRVQ